MVSVRYAIRSVDEGDRGDAQPGGPSSLLWILPKVESSTMPSFSARVMRFTIWSASCCGVALCRSDSPTHGHLARELRH